MSPEDAVVVVIEILVACCLVLVALGGAEWLLARAVRWWTRT